VVLEAVLRCVAERRVGFVCWYMAWSFASFLVEFFVNEYTPLW
jgi:hypothetical protein